MGNISKKVIYRTSGNCSCVSILAARLPLCASAAAALPPLAITRARCMCAVKRFFYAKKSSLTTAMTLLMSRAFQRCVVSTGSRFLGPQHQARRACASYCPRALHVRIETFFPRKKKQPSHCHLTTGLTGSPTSCRVHQKKQHSAL